MDSSKVQQIITDVLRELGLGATDLSPEIRIKHDSVVKEIAAYYPWAWLHNIPVTLTTMGSVAYVEISTYIESIESMYITDKYHTIGYVSPAEYDRLISLNSTVGADPTQYTIKGNRIYLYPIPDSAMTLNLDTVLNSQQIDNVTSPVLNGIIAALPDYFESIIKAGILKELDSAEMQSAWRNQFYANLELRRNNEVSKKKITPRISDTMRGSRAYFRRY